MHVALDVTERLRRRFAASARDPQARWTLPLAFTGGFLLFGSAWVVACELLLAPRLSGFPSIALGLVPVLGGSIVMVGIMRWAGNRLHETRAPLDPLFESFPAPTLLFDVEGHVQKWNAAAERTFGWAADEVKGRLPPFVPAQKRAEFAAHRERVLNGERLVNVPAIRVRRDGTSVDVMISAAPVRDRKGRVTGAVAVMVDRTEHQRVEEELNASRERLMESEHLNTLGTLVASVAHEVNNPLMSIRANAELVRFALEDAVEPQAKDEEAAKEAVREALDRTDRVLTYIDQVAHVTRSLKRVARQDHGTRRPEDVNAIVDGVLALVASRLDANVDVDLQLDTVAPANVCASEISQVLLNLLLNASDAMCPQGWGVLTIATRDEGKHVIVDVTDTGPGVPEDAREKLFVPFFTTKPDGTGLGLSISARLVEAHGGRLTLADTSPHGSTFSVALPRADVPVMTPDPETESQYS